MSSSSFSHLHAQRSRTQKHQNHDTTSGRAYQQLYLLHQPIPPRSSARMPILYPNATVWCPHISRGSTSSMTILQYLRRSHRTAESKLPPTAAGCISATEQSTDFLRPPPGRIWYKLMLLNAGILKRWALLTQLCNFLLLNWMFSPRWIVAGCIF